MSTRVIRYNRSPETKREQSEAQKRKRPLAMLLTCVVCETDFTPKVGNQKRCNFCIAAKRYA